MLQQIRGAASLAFDLRSKDRQRVLSALLTRDCGVDVFVEIDPYGAMTPSNTFRQRYLFFIVDIQSGTRLTACAVEMFDAPNDVEATHIANSLFEACDDAFYGYKLRQGTRTVATNLRDHSPLPKLDLRAVVAQRQANIRSIEETLLSTYECLWRSKKLLKELDRRPPKRR